MSPSNPFSVEKRKESARSWYATFDSCTSYACTSTIQYYQFQSAQLDWYDTTVYEGAAADELFRKVLPANELIFENGTNHVFLPLNLSFALPFFGQSLKQVLLSSAGGILTSLDEDIWSEDASMEMPNHIAPFLTNMPPDQWNDEVYYRDDEGEIENI